MRVLLIHNTYRMRGGEDTVVDSETQLLRDNGHEVVVYHRSNAMMSRIDQLWMPRLLWSRQTYRELSRLIETTRPDIAHVHNPFFLMSPAAYQACYDHKIPIVQTLHNFRFLCVQGLCSRSQQVCELCLHQGFWPGVRFRCFQHSFLKSAVAAGISAHYRRRGILKNLVRRLIAPSRFCKDMYTRYARIDGAKVDIKPHFIADPGPAVGCGDYVLYVGAIRNYKGIQVLLEAARRMPEVPIRIVGKVLPEFCRPSDLPNVEFLGECSMERTLEIMKGSACLVVPSLCYETFARVVIEAYACGRPVVASRLGALIERVQDGQTGFLAEPGSAQDFAYKIQRLMQDQDRRRIMGEAARRAYEKYYTPRENYRQLMDIYEKALDTEGEASYNEAGHRF